MILNENSHPWKLDFDNEFFNPLSADPTKWSIKCFIKISKKYLIRDERRDRERGTQVFGGGKISGDIWQKTGFRNLGTRGRSLPPPPLVRNPVKFLYSDANRGSCQTHGMEPFAKTVNGFKSIL